MKKLIILSLVLALTAPVTAEPKREILQKHQRVQNDNYTVFNVIAAQEYTQSALFGSNSWHNYVLTKEDLNNIAKDENFVPEYRKLKPRILTDVNRVRGLAGLPGMIEKQIQIPIREYWDFSPWTDSYRWRTSGKLTGETMPGYRYEESANIDPNKIVRDKPL
jgi:hypothetical protein